MLQAKPIYQDIEALIKGYLQKLAIYTNVQFEQKTSPETWSLGQMYEHLITSSSFFRYQIKLCLSQQKGQLGGEKNSTGENMYQYGSFPPIKIKIPEAWKGPEPSAKPKEAYHALLQKELDSLCELVDIIQDDAGEYKTMHAVCGMLNALEWFKMAEMHLKHHLTQAKELENQTS